ncbi:nucleophosmin-like isoform X1 [Salvelinus alpinus]|uniref:nucleophosmin-like isoform X1 n=1 Tax=Salvelinus alpinus TaxID=8036 RepID=UPI0039FB9749
MADDSVPDITRFQMYLFGCTLKSDKKEFKVEEDDDADHQLSLKAVCLGAEAEDKFHTVEIEGITYDGKTTKIPLAVLKPSVLPSMNLGGFGITPPVTFRLQSGCGPVYISGQHFINVKDSDDEEEENSSSPVTRPSSLTSGKRPAPVCSSCCLLSSLLDWIQLHAFRSKMIGTLDKAKTDSKIKNTNTELYKYCILKNNYWKLCYFILIL